MSERVPIRVFLPLVSSVVLTGLAAGFFFAYSANVVLALDRLSAPAYTGVMQPINETVRNPAFAAVFFGAAVVAALGAVMIFLEGAMFTRYGLLFIAGLAVYLGGIIAVTGSVHVPMNEYIATWSQTAPPPDWAAVRARWARWNLVRTGASITSFVLYLAATVALVGRSA
jgi:uncharacterized membrane protein